MKKGEKIGIGAAIVIGVLVGGFFVSPFILELFTSDIPPIDDRDLRLEKVILFDANNAYFDLMTGGTSLALTEEQETMLANLAAGKAWDDDRATTMITEHANALVSLATAAQKTFQDIEFADPVRVRYNTHVPLIAKWRTLIRLNILSARSLARQGKGDEALREIVKTIRIGTAISDAQAPVVEYLVGLGITQLGLETLIDIIPTSSFSAQGMQDGVRQLGSSKMNNTGLQNAFKVEYAFTSDMIDAMAEGNPDAIRTIIDPLSVAKRESDEEQLVKKVKNSYYFRPNKTKKIHADYTRALIANTKKLCGSREFPRVEAPSRSPLRQYFSDNALGNILTTMTIASYEGLFRKKCQVDTLVTVTQAMLALKAYQSEYGVLPSSLDELVPAYLPAVPIDPYDGKPLRYSLSKKILYSVGADFTDEGGSDGDDWRNMNGPTFSIAF